MRFTLPRDLYHGKGALENLKNLEGKKAIICVGGGSMKRNGFLDRAVKYLEEADYSCAVENAAPELIKCADEVIHMSVPQYINQRKK